MALPAQSVPIRTPRLTPAQLDIWQACGFQYAAQKRDATQWTLGDSPSFGLALGKAAHEVVAHVNRLLVGNTSFPEVDTTLERFFNPSHFADEEQALEGRHAAGAMLDQYREYLTKNELTVLSFERFVKTPEMTVAGIASFVLSGKIDAILRAPDGTITAMDFKTGSLLPPREVLSSRLSTAAYRCLAKQLHPKGTPVLIGQLLLTTGIDVTVDLSDDDVQRSKALIGKLALALHEDPLMMGPMFQPTMHEGCAYCRYQAMCPLFGDNTGADSEVVW